MCEIPDQRIVGRVIEDLPVDRIFQPVYLHPERIVRVPENCDGVLQVPRGKTIVRPDFRIGKVR